MPVASETDGDGADESLAGSGGSLRHVGSVLHGLARVDPVALTGVDGHPRGGGSTRGPVGVTVALISVAAASGDDGDAFTTTRAGAENSQDAGSAVA